MLHPLFPLRARYPVCFVLSSLLLLSACEPKPSVDYHVRRSYQYRLTLRSPGVEYQLRDKASRFYPFQARQVSPGVVMFAYFIEYHGGGGYSIFSPPKSTKLDTVEVAVTAATADSLFLLANHFLHTLQPSDVDTIRPGQTVYYHTDDAWGQLRLDWNGQRLVGEVEALQTSSVAPQSHAFWQAYRCFHRLFQRPGKRN